MSEKYKSTCKYLNYVEHWFIVVSTITGCVSTSSFASLVCVPVCFTSSTLRLKICATTAGNKKYESCKEK